MAAATLLAGCASTRVSLTPPGQAPVCDRTATALVLWSPHWRADQKDVAAREAAAAAGLDRFVAESGCFAGSTLRRLTDPGPASVEAALAGTSTAVNAVVVIGVRELGPVVRLGSAALVEGGTEVVLHVVAHDGPQRARRREFTVHWQHGGPGVVKGVASLSADMQAALVAGLQPEAARK